jgi:hypothetical protein
MYLEIKQSERADITSFSSLPVDEEENFVNYLPVYVLRKKRMISLLYETKCLLFVSVTTKVVFERIETLSPNQAKPTTPKDENLFKNFERLKYFRF